MLTILFDGIAYGMVLFVLACGLSVTMGLMNFVNLAHGAFAMVGGYVTVAADAAARPALPGEPAAGLPLGALVGTRAGAADLPADVRQEPSRSGDVLDRAGLHGGRGHRLADGLEPAVHPPAGLAAGPLRARRHRHRALPALRHRRLRAARGRPAMGLHRAPASAAACARRWTMHAWRAASASRSTGSSRSPSRWARGWPGSAARSASSSWVSTRPFR